MPPTVAALTSRYDGQLQPLLPPGCGVCAVCATSMTAPDLMCWQCARHRELPARADAVAAVSLAVKHGRFAYELGAYKSNPHRAARRQIQRALAAVLWRWLARHEPCLARTAGAARFDIVTVVPSRRGRPAHPLRDMVRRQVPPTAARFRDLLVCAPGAGFSCRPIRTGVSVLLVDDTWTSGTHAQQAACALKRACAGPVAVLALGRHFNADGDTAHGAAARAYLARARLRGWSWRHCRGC